MCRYNLHQSLKIQLLSRNSLSQQETQAHSVSREINFIRKFREYWGKRDVIPNWMKANELNLGGGVFVVFVETK